MKRVIFRADGDEAIGMGHVIRCIALGSMIKSAFRIEFITKSLSPSVLNRVKQVFDAVHILPQSSVEEFAEIEPWLSPGDIIVLDGYSFIEKYQNQVRSYGCRLVCIADIPGKKYVADVLINHAPGADPRDYNCLPSTKFCFGLDFAMLQLPFLQAASVPRLVSSTDTLFVNMGAADYQNLTKLILEAAASVSGIKKIHVVIGSMNRHIDEIRSFCSFSDKQIMIHENVSSEEMFGVMKACQVAVCPASTVAIELCSVGTGIVCGFFVDNQKSIYQGLEKDKMILGVGDFTQLRSDQLANLMGSLNVNGVNYMINRQKRAIDGKSEARLVNVFQALAI